MVNRMYLPKSISLKDYNKNRKGVVGYVGMQEAFFFEMTDLIT